MFPLSNPSIISHLVAVTFSINQGQWVSILGHNGSGKSTLSKLLIGLLKADRGSIEIHGLTMNEDNVNAIRKHIGIVFQNPDNQFVGVTVKHDIAFGLENMQVPRDEMKELVYEFAQKVGMGKYMDKEPHSLSGGQKQRVAIAGMLAMNLDVMVFDEATSMLDPEGTKSVVELIKRLKTEYNKTIITITHDLELAALSDRIIVLNKGKVVADGKTEDIFKQVALLEEAELDIPFQLKLVNAVSKDSDLSQKKALVDALWAYNSKK